MTGPLCERNHMVETEPMEGLRLCAPCLRQTERNLTSLPALHEECVDHVFGGPRDPARQRVAGSREVAPLNDSAIETRSNISGVLTAWSSSVAEEKGTPAPGSSVRHLTHFLLTHLNWLATSTEAVVFADEIESLTTEARRTMDPAPEARLITLGRCVEPDCAEIITAAAPGRRISNYRGIGCAAGHSWEIHEWFLLQSRIEQKKGVGA